LDEDGPLSIRPYSGSSWAKSGYPKRLPATYTRTEKPVQLVAAFNPHDGIGFGKCYDIKDAYTFIDFFYEIERRYPNTDVHLILDNLSAHKAAVRIFNIYKPDHKFVFHYIPSNSSWLNLIERWFGVINRRALNNSDYKTRIQLMIALYQAIHYTNVHAKPYTWKVKDSKAS
jgi:transposase